MTVMSCRSGNNTDFSSTLCAYTIIQRKQAGQ